MSTTQTIRGTVTKVFYCNAETPSMAGAMDTKEGEVRFAGKCAAKEGDLLEVTGEWTEHPKFGRQLTVETGLVKLDESPEALAHLLAKDKRFKGLGPVRARAVVDAALALSDDGDMASALLAYPSEIAAQAGVNVAMVHNAAEIWNEKRSYFDAVAALIGQGWTSGQSTTIVHFMGEGCPPLVSQDPYDLISQIPRFGFRTVDAVALKLGIVSTDPQRLAAGIAYCLDQIASDGNTWTTREGLIDTAMQELRPDTLDAEDRIFETLDELIRMGIVFEAESPLGNTVVAYAALARVEFSVFERLLDGLADDSLGEITIRSGGSFDTLNVGQTEAVLGFSKRRYIVISGGAGVGKTYTMRTICEVSDAANLKIGLCAPTGKAARKLHHATGRDAKTIHRLLEPVFDERTGKFRFLRHSGNPLELDLVIIDEFSMVDVRLICSLLDALGPETRLLIVGDHHQIPSVGPGAVLRDILAARERYPDAVHVLTEIVRQAGELERNTSAILDGKLSPGYKDGKIWQLRSVEKGHEKGTPAMISTVVEYVTNTPDLFPFNRQLDFNWEVQVLSPQKKGSLGVYALNAELQKLRQRLLGNKPPEPTEKDKSPRPLPGDRVMWIKNDYELNLMNGTQAILVSIKKGAMLLFTEDGREVTVPPSKRFNVELAYALTIHKSQGSEWPFVIMVASSKHSHMHDRNLLYTGASRSSEALMIFGDMAGMHRFARHMESAKRQTFGGFLVHGWKADALPLDVVASPSSGTSLRIVK